jgi:hypothetical protein
MSDRMPDRIGEGILYGQFHIGQTHLRFHRTILELDGRMNDGLGMHHNLYLSGFRSKSHLASITSSPLFISVAESIVTFDPHIPVGMVQGLLHGDRGQLLTIHAPEWPSAGSKVDLFHRIEKLSHQTLEDGRMFRIDRNDGCAVLFTQAG